MKKFALGLMAALYILIQTSIAGAVVVSTDDFPTLVDYDVLVDSLVVHGYGWSSKDINSNNFPVLKHDKQIVFIHFKIVRFDECLNLSLKFKDKELYKYCLDLDSGKVITEMDKLGLRPANIHEFLSFFKEHSDAQLKALGGGYCLYRTLALGSTWRNENGDLGIVYFFTNIDISNDVKEKWKRRRFLNMTFFDNIWFSGEDCFLAVQK